MSTSLHAGAALPVATAAASGHLDDIALRWVVPETEVSLPSRRSPLVPRRNLPEQLLNQIHMSEHHAATAISVEAQLIHRFTVHMSAVTHPRICVIVFSRTHRP